MASVVLLLLVVAVWPGWKMIVDGAGVVRRSAVWKVVAETGPSPPCAGGSAGGFELGGLCPPGADLADVGGHQQRCGERGAGGDAADPAAGWLGEGVVGGVFGVAAEAFDGVAQGAWQVTQRATS